MTLDPVSLTPVPPRPELEHSSVPQPEMHRADDWLQIDSASLPPAEVPHLGHAILFFVLVIPMLFAGEALTALLAKQLHLLGNQDYRELFVLIASDARLAIPAQVFTYALVILVAMILFPLLWRQPFAQGIQWNAQVVRSKFAVLLALGLGIGVGITMLGNYLPMPKDPPIMRDMMGSPLGAWMMLFFGITFAPITEELAFRGFLLPGFIHTFRWLMQREILSSEALAWATIPLSAVLTTIPFALLHATQVSQAWAPLLLIGLVSIALCAVRLQLHSVAASSVVHAAYNFTLFAGLLLQTDGFRHLEKLNS
jgi:membrane protease YdiL (CAAX protease family)